MTRSARSTASPCARTRRRWRCAASRWRNSARSSARDFCCAKRRAASACARRFRARAASSPRRKVALASRDLGWAAKTLDAARGTLEAQGDRINAAHARYLEARRLLLIGRLDEAEAKLTEIDAAPLPPALRAIHALVLAGIALRRLRTKDARTALARAERAAREAHIPALLAEVETAGRMLTTPAARSIARGTERPLLLEDVEKLLASKALVIDACRYAVCRGDKTVSLAGRPVLFALARALGEAWPEDVPRDVLLARGFGAKFTDDSHRARLRVEIGRLRAKLRPLARIDATPRGFALAPLRAKELVVLARPVEEEHAAVLAFLADGESWSSSALALALGASQRSVQRALDALAASGKVQSFGRGRARRWLTPPVPGFTTTLLLPAPLPGD